MEKAELNEGPTKSGRSPNIAQRIEQKLWKYSASGNVAKRWLLEIISWTISALSMSAIVGVLCYLHDKPTPSWPFGLTLNAYISVLSKVASAALLLPVSEALGQLKWLWFQGGSKKMWDFEIFDNASRGPWGSFLLLIRTKGTTLAALGAAITIFALALDPFFQQIVVFPSRMALNPALNSTIPIVVKYEPIYDTATQGGIETIQFEQGLQAVAQKYLYEDAAQPLPFGKDVRPDIPLSCPTSNCTWPEYETLGVCSACEDISNLLTYECITGPLDWIANVTIINNTDTLDYTNGTMCGWFINSTSIDPAIKPVFMSGYRKANPSLPYDEALLTRIVPLVSPNTRTPLYGTGSYHFKDVRNSIIDFFVASTTDAPHSAYGRERPIAHECVLAWCVKTLKSSYFEANYTEEVTKTITNTTPAEYPWKSVYTVTPMGPGYIQQYSRDILVDYNGTQYGASSAANVRTTAIFDDYFPSVYVQSNESDVAYLRYQMQFTDGSPPFLRNISYNPFLAPNNVSEHMGRLAKALTDTMRTSGQHVWLDGQVFSVETFVQVRWAWLSLPVGLLVFTLLFLVGTVIKSSLAKEHMGVWKTSAIATLLYGLPDEMQKKITAPALDDATRTPRAKTKELRVRMQPKTGWRVSGNMFSPFITPKVKQGQPPPGWI